MTIRHYKETKVSTKNNQKISYWPIFNPAYYVYLFYMSIYKSHTHLLIFCKEKKHFLFYIFILLIGIYFMQGWTATTRNEVTRKRRGKRKKFGKKKWKDDLKEAKYKMCLLTLDKKVIPSCWSSASFWSIHYTRVQDQISTPSDFSVVS